MASVEPTAPAQGTGWEQPPTSRARRGALALAVALAVAVSLAAAVATSREASDVLPVGETETAMPQEQAFGHLEPMASAPISARAGPVHAWTGEELLVWGGGSVGELSVGPASVEFLADGAAYDPEADGWRLLPPSPLEPRAGAAAVWASDRLIVWGGHDEQQQPLADGAAYVPAEDRWELLPPGPAQGRTGASAAFADGHLFVVGGVTGSGGTDVPTGPDAVPGAGLMLDVEAGTWRELAMPEDWNPDPWSGLASVDERVLLWQRRRGWSHAPEAGRWDPLPSLPARARTSDDSRLVALDDRRVLVAGVRPAGGQRALGTLFDVEEGWTDAVGVGLTSPLRTLRIGAGDGVVFALADDPESGTRAPATALVWDAARDRVLRAPPELTAGRVAYAAAWTGEELLVWGGYGGGATLADGTRWRLSGGR